MEIRRYRPEDNQAVKDLHVRALASSGIIPLKGPWNADLDDIESIYLARGEFLVGTIDDKVVAMGALRPVGPDRGEIKRMRTEPKLQGQGYGQQILTLLEKRAWELGFKTLQLDTGESLKVAQHFYEKNNYKEMRRGLLGDQPTIFYEKTLIDGNI